MRNIITTLALVASAAAPAIAAPAEAPLSGKVQGPDGKPLSSVFVQQQGAISSAITDEKGAFSLKLDPKGRQVLVFTAVGFVGQEVAADRAQSVTLRPVPAYRPTFAKAPAQEVAVGNAIFDTQVGLGYALRNQLVNTGGRTVEGLAVNGLVADARYRVSDAVFGVSGYRVKAPIQVSPLTTQPNPAPSVDHSEWSLSAGHIVRAAGIDFLPQLVYSNSFIAPGYATPWTGTPMDFSQSRHALALGLEAGKRFGDLEVIGRGKLPLLKSVTSSAPYALGDVTWGDVGILLGYNVMPGLRLDLTATQQWAGATNTYESTQLFGIGLSYHPERVAP
ncbi:MAG TPA: carboxypeptidase regulatory-like domain-containing protein [Pantanalinema sp.]